jgi:hypothetical protein
VSVAAQAEFVSAPQLADWLAEAQKSGGSFKDRTLALGYVSGVHDAFERSEICTPDGTSGKILLKSVRDWMIANPDRWPAGGALTVRRALAETYPCTEAPDASSRR